MSIMPINMSMLDASFGPEGSGQQEKDNEKQGFSQENNSEKNREKVHEKPAKESIFSIFESPESDPQLTKQEKKIEKEKKKEIERKIKENEKIEKENKEYKRKLEKKNKDEEKRMAKEKKKEMEKKIQEDTKIEKEKIYIKIRKIKTEISQVEAEYKRRKERNCLERAEVRRINAEYAKLHPSLRDLHASHKTSLQQEWHYRDERAKYEKDHQVQQLESNLKALDLQLTMAGEEVLRLHQLKAEDEISKEQARERLRRSTQAERSVAQPRQTAQAGEEEPTKKCTLPVVSQEVNSSMEENPFHLPDEFKYRTRAERSVAQPRQSAQSGEEEPTKKCTLPVVSQEFNSSMEENPFYLPEEFKYRQMEEWGSDTCKEWIYDFLENGLTDLEQEQLILKLENMPPICGKRMFGATEEEWVQWLANRGLLIHDRLQNIAEVEVDM